MTYLAPAAWMARIHWSTSSRVGLKTFGSALPSPHSRSRNELVPKWMRAPISSSCHSTCCGEGLMSEKFWAPLGDAARDRKQHVEKMQARRRIVVKFAALSREAMQIGNFASGYGTWSGDLRGRDICIEVSTRAPQHNR